MAYDPEARQQSNSAMIIGVVALVLLVVGALAYFSTQNTQAEPTNHTTVITPPTETVERTEVVPVPNSAPPVVIERSAPAAPATRVIERDTKTTVTRDRTAPDTSAAPSGDTTTTTTETTTSP